MMSLVLLGIYKLIDHKKPESDDADIDWWVTVSFVLAPMFLVFMIGSMISSAGLAVELFLLAYSLYFFIPFLYLIGLMDYSVKKWFKYAIWVPLVAIVIEILVIIIRSGISS